MLCGCNRAPQPSEVAFDESILAIAHAAPLTKPTEKSSSSTNSSSRPTPEHVTKIQTKETLPGWAQSHVIHRVRVKPGEKVFALTFDDGPWPRYTREILQMLAAADIKATFFMVGQEVRAHSEIAREVRDAGHAIGNHSWSHPSRPRSAVAQVRNTDNEIKRVLGFAPNLFRPPYGILKNGMARQAMKEKQTVVMWSADAYDWKRPGAQRIANRIVRQASPGGIALMHDGGGNRSQTVAALPIIISTLRARGYRFVTVPELLRMRYVAPKLKKAAAKSTSHKSAAKQSTVHKS